MINLPIHTRWINALQKQYKAHIADVDGNLTEEKEKTERLSDEIINRIKQKLILGIPFGICSARSLRQGEILDNIQQDVINGLSKEAIKNFFVFPEQGTIAISFDVDSSGCVLKKELDLVNFFNIYKTDNNIINDITRHDLFNYLNKNIQTSNALQYKSSKKYGFLATVIKKENMPDQEYSSYVGNTTKEINRLLSKNDPIYEAFCTRSAIYVATKGATKELSLRYLSYLYNISIDEIVGTDDQGEITGVGWTLTHHKAGFSTNTYDINSNNQIPLSLVCQKKGKDAWLFLDDNLTYVKI